MTVFYSTKKLLSSKQGGKNNSKDIRHTDYVQFQTKKQQKFKVRLHHETARCGPSGCRDNLNMAQIGLNGGISVNGVTS